MPWWLLLGLLSLKAVSIHSQESMRVLSYNIRYHTSSDGPNAWPHRKATMLDSLQHTQASILCFQEALHHQYTYLKKGLTAYASYGVGRNNGKTKGEYVPVFYLKTQWKALDKGTFWLSEQPDLPSKGWDATIPRIVSWVKLQHLRSGRQVFVFNTHFDHRGKEARLKSAALLVKKVMEIAGQAAYVVAGDFNLSPEHPSYPVLTKAFNDTRNTASDIKGHVHTFGGFDASTLPTNPSRIDFIFTDKGTKALAYDCPTWLASPLRHLSDHHPVICEVVPFE